eukprot:5049047-Prymnesium_polylepis.1
MPCASRLRWPASHLGEHCVLVAARARRCLEVRLEGADLALQPTAEVLLAQQLLGLCGGVQHVKARARVG